MPLPSGLSTFTLSFGPYLDLEGNVAFGGVQGKLSVSPPIVDSTSGTLIFKSVDFYIDNDGTATVGPLVANDDPRINQGTQYAVEWQVRSSLPSPPNKTFVVPIASGASVDYDLLASATGAVAGPYVLPLVTSVAGRSGAVTLGKADVGLGSVDNTADTAKPVSTAQATALAAKATIADIPTAGTATGDALRAAFVPKWKPSTAYASGEPVLNPSGQIVTANSAFTSGASYNAANWTIVSGGGGGSVTVLDEGATLTARSAINFVGAGVTATDDAANGRTTVTVPGGGTVSDATTGAKGIVQLAGDLGGTAAAPTVPGLSSKLAAASNLSDLASAATARTNLGLGTAATQSTAAFDAAGAGTAAAAGKGNLGEFAPAGGILPPQGDDTMWVQSFAAGAFTGQGAGSALADTGDVLLGSTTALLQTVGDGTTLANLSVTGLTAVDLTGQQLKVWVQVDQPLNLSSVKVILGSGGGFANTYNVPVQLASSAGTAGLQLLQAGQWQLVSLNFQDATAVGTPDRTAINALRIQAKDTGVAVTVKIAGVAYFPEPSAAFPNGVITLCFDDGYLSQYTTAAPYLDKYGMSATALPIVDRIGAGGQWMSLAQLQSLQNLHGWEVGGHANTVADHDARLTTLSTAALQADFAANRDWLRANGFHGTDLTAYPGGIYNSTVKATARSYWSFARGVVSNTHESFPPGDPYVARGYPVDNSTGGPSLANIEAAVDAAKANKGWLVLVLHDIQASASANTIQWSTANFQALIDYIAVSGVPVRTMGDVLREKRAGQVLALSALRDAAITSPANGDVPTYNSTTKKWTNQQPAGGSASPLSTEGFCFTVDPRYQKSSAVVFPGANRTYFMRAQGAKTGATKFRIFVGVQSGNISLAVYSNTGSGPASLPTGTPKIATGSVACPVAGDAVITPGGSWNVVEGDWIALSCDNATASFAAGVNTGAANQYAGLSGLASVFPAPNPIGTSPVATNQSFYVACE